MQVQSECVLQSLTLDKNNRGRCNKEWSLKFISIVRSDANVIVLLIVLLLPSSTSKSSHFIVEWILDEFA